MISGTHTAETGAQTTPRWRRWVRHPLFPVLLWVLLSPAIGDEYPFANFSMYSNPSSRPLKYYFLTDGEGQPIATQTYTGVRIAAITKQVQHHTDPHLEKWLKIQEKAGVKPTNEEVAAAKRLAVDAAGIEVLQYLREKSLRRATKRHLTGELRLMETAIRFGDQKFERDIREVARIPALTP